MAQLRIAILIPARYGSSRFPGKALHPLEGVPMAKRVYDTCKSVGFDTFLLSDDERICQLVEYSLYTSHECENGTERCAEAAARLKNYDAFINVQGDMPDITADIIQAVAEALVSRDLVTVYTAMSTRERANPNSVKLIHNGEAAIWCCRAGLKYGDHHLGVYGYHKKLLAAYCSLPRCLAESLEGLEQLRWLNAGYRMAVVEVKFEGTEINTPEDVSDWTHRRQRQVQSR